MENQKQHFTNIGRTSIPSFAFEKYGVNGVGKNRLPMISMDKYIDHSQDLDLHLECCKGLAITDNYKMGMIYGGVPPEEALRFSNKNSWSEMFDRIDEYDPTGVHKKVIYELAETAPNPLQAVYKYMYYAMGAVIPWFFACYLKQNNFSTKSKDTGLWTENTKHFPKLMEYLKTLPFKEIGRVLFFTTYPNAGVLIHRDSIVEEHKDHNINLFFDGGWRPSFVYDEIKKEKIYLEKDARSYFFNNRDYHGVDAEPIFRYTLRVDGTFRDELCEELNLEDGYTWKWKYKDSD